MSPLWSFSRPLKKAPGGAGALRGTNWADLRVPLQQRHKATDQGADGREPHDGIPDDVSDFGIISKNRIDDLGDAEEADCYHRAGEDDADWRGRDAMSVGEPKMERHHCRLDEQTADDHAESGLDHRIIRAPLDELRERREIERARFRIDQTDAGKHHETGERVCDGKIQGAGNRRTFQLVAGERERGDAHHLEPDEQVEEVVRQREADHGGAARGSGQRRCPLRPSKERGVPEERSRHFASSLRLKMARTTAWLSEAPATSVTSQSRSSSNARIEASPDHAFHLDFARQWFGGSGFPQQGLEVTSCGAERLSDAEPCRRSIHHRYCDCSPCQAIPPVPRDAGHPHVGTSVPVLSNPLGAEFEERLPVLRKILYRATYRQKTRGCYWCSGPMHVL